MNITNLDAVCLDPTTTLDLVVPVSTVLATEAHDDHFLEKGNLGHQNRRLAILLLAVLVTSHTKRFDLGHIVSVRRNVRKHWLRHLLNSATPQNRERKKGN